MRFLRLRCLAYVYRWTSRHLPNDILRELHGFIHMFEDTPEFVAPYQIGDIAQYPELVRPLVTLEAQVPGSWYINAIATHEHCRGQGVARRLMADAASQARQHHCTLMSLIVASENQAAIRLYNSIGFSSVQTLPVVPYPGALHGGQWVLMTKAVDAAGH